MAKTTAPADDHVSDVNEEAPSSYTTSTPQQIRNQGTGAIAPGFATGRRKRAIARVRMTPGTGTWKINGRAMQDYFPNKVHQQMIQEPLKIVEVEQKFDIFVRLVGGGVSGQAGAVQLGVARTLNKIDREKNRPPLKKAGMMTRDGRAKERKKAGLKKARKASQYSKR